MVQPDSCEVSRVSQYLGSQPIRPYEISPTGLSPSLVDISMSFGYNIWTRRPIRVSARSAPTTPKMQRTRAYTQVGFRLFPVRSPLLRESLLLSLPQVTEMFHFSWSRFRALCIQVRILRHYPQWVAPFGNPRVKGCLRLTEAYRSLPRPSSPSGTKSSIISSL